MKTLVIYYSRSGHTEKLARSIADALDADLEPIVDKTSRRGLLGYLRSGYEAVSKKLAPIDAPKHDLASYDLVVVGTPIWGAMPSSPVRAFLAQQRKDLKAVAFFCTCGGRGAEKVFAEMSSLTGKSPADVLVLREAELAGEFSDRVARFVREIRLALEPPRARAPAAVAAHP